jgi:hypothetical protein
LEKWEVARAVHHMIDTHGARAAAVAQRRAQMAGTETGAMTWGRIAEALHDLEAAAPQSRLISR